MAAVPNMEARPSTGGTTVVGLGVRADSLVEGQGPVESFLDPFERDDDESLVEQLGPLLESGRHVVAIHPRWFASASRLRLEMADCLLGRPRLALYETSLPPLAGGVLAALASALSIRLGSPGLTHAALPDLEEQLHRFAWLGSVKGLEEPSPRLIQHATSWWPWTKFAVSSWPQPAVRRLTKQDRGVPLPELAGPHGLAFSIHEGDPAWVTATLAPALGLEPAEVAATPHGPAWWGTDRLVEAVAYPTDMAALAARLGAALEARTCGWCGELVAAEPCPFCGATEHGTGPPVA